MKNVLILHTDQQRADSLGCTGNRYAITPHLDQLAEQGVCFERHIAANPVCMPSRTSFFTGLYPPGHGVWNNGVALNRRSLIPVNGTQFVSHENMTPQPLTMPDLFASHGYDTASFGKLHLTPNFAPESWHFPEGMLNWRKGEFDDWHGPYYGFRTVDLTLNHGEGPCRLGHYALWLKEHHPEVLEALNAEKTYPAPAMNNLYVSSLPMALQNSNWLADRFISFLESDRQMDRPFFAFVGFPDPHGPFTPCPDALERFEDRPVMPPRDPQGNGFRLTDSMDVLKYRRHVWEQLTAEQRELPARYTNAMVYQIDCAVGKIIEALKQNGRWDDTIVVFTSDHGDFLGDHNLIQKDTVGNDSLCRVPLLLRDPQGTTLPKRIDAPMSNCDVMPTLAALAGIDVPDGLHGTNIVEALNAGRETHAFCYATGGDPASVNHTIYDRRHRLTWYPVDGFVELFDHHEDPQEARNLAEDTAYREVRQLLIHEIERHLARHHCPIVGRYGAW